jgi:hypothetical protein
VKRAGIDFNEVFALVACLESVRMLVALVAHERWTVHHMDVKSEFLNGMLKEEVYVHQPPLISSPLSTRARSYAFTKHCMDFSRHPGPGMPSSMPPWHRLVSRGADRSTASTCGAEKGG